MARFPRYWYAGDDGFEQPIVPLNVDDDSGEWLVGTQRLFAGIAVAAILATSQNLAAQSQLRHGYSPDEVPTVPPPALNDGAWPRATPPLVTFVRISGDDDFSLPPVAGIVTRDEWNVIVTPAQYRAPQVFTDSDEFVPAPAATLGVQEDEYIPQARPPQPLRVVFSDEDELPVVVAPTLTVDEEGWTPRSAQSVLRPQIFSAEDELPALAVDEEGAWLGQAAQRVTRVPAPFTDEGELAIAPAPTLAVDEETFLPRSRAPQQRPQLFPALVTGEDELPLPPAPTLGVVEDYWLLPRPLAPQGKPVLFAEEEEFPEPGVVPVVPPADFPPWGGGGTWINGRRIYHGPRAQINLERPVTPPERRAEERVARAEAKRDATAEHARRVAEELARRQRLLESELERQELALEIGLKLAERELAERALAALLAEQARLERVQARLEKGLARSLESLLARYAAADAAWAAMLADEDEALALLLVAIASEEKLLTFN